MPKTQKLLEYLSKEYNNKRLNSLTKRCILLACKETGLSGIDNSHVTSAEFPNFPTNLHIGGVKDEIDDNFKELLVSEQLNEYANSVQTKLSHTIEILSSIIDSTHLEEHFLKAGDVDGFVKLDKKRATEFNEILKGTFNKQINLWIDEARSVSEYLSSKLEGNINSSDDNTENIQTTTSTPNLSLRQRILVIKYLEEHSRFNPILIHQDVSRQAIVYSSLMNLSYKKTYDTLRESLDSLKRNKKDLLAVQTLFRNLKIYPAIIQEIEADLKAL